MWNTGAGTVYIVGAGPGNVDLLTVKAHRLIQQADAVVYDNLVSDEILALIPAGSIRIFAGKRCREHIMTQDEIHHTLLTLASKKQTIVRLKGGDPFTFGRGGEEALFLAEHHISYEIVPGITSASACAAYAGIPLTHRGLATAVTYISGHRQKNGELDIEWHTLTDPNLTVVCYMSLGTADIISEKLIAAGRSADTPAAIIQDGARDTQRVAVTTLKNLAYTIEKENFSTPALLVIGVTATLSHSIGWSSEMNQFRKSLSCNSAKNI